MNLSGGPVSRAAGFFKIPAQRVVVAYDDVALSFGSLRIRAKGSAGGQKGMKDIIKALGTDQVPRLRMGIDGRRGRRDLADFVLSDFSAGERKQLPELFDHAQGALEEILSRGVDRAGSRFNRTVKQEEAG
jgi:PTH1 family peptidyl-tRNA hydrolase